MLLLESHETRHTNTIRSHHRRVGAGTRSVASTTAGAPTAVTFFLPSTTREEKNGCVTKHDYSGPGRLYILGLFLGIDLIMAGAAWIGLGFGLRHPR
jgi:hypothetical protein